MDGTLSNVTGTVSDIMLDTLPIKQIQKLLQTSDIANVGVDGQNLKPILNQIKIYC
jgi:hypothetical protein